MIAPAGTVALHCSTSRLCAGLSEVGASGRVNIPIMILLPCTRRLSRFAGRPRISGAAQPQAPRQRARGWGHVGGRKPLRAWGQLIRKEASAQGPSMGRRAQRKKPQWYKQPAWPRALLLILEVTEVTDGFRFACCSAATPTPPSRPATLAFNLLFLLFLFFLFFFFFFFLS